MPTPFETARRDINHDALFATIAECFRADHDPVNEPLPERLATLLQQVEQAIRADNEWAPQDLLRLMQGGSLALTNQPLMSLWHERLTAQESPGGKPKPLGLFLFAPSLPRSFENGPRLP
jgi:hypothetical protein